MESMFNQFNTSLSRTNHSGVAKSQSVASQPSALQSSVLPAVNSQQTGLQAANYMGMQPASPQLSLDLLLGEFLNQFTQLFSGVLQLFSVLSGQTPQPSAPQSEMSAPSSSPMPESESVNTTPETEQSEIPMIDPEETVSENNSQSEVETPNETQTPTEAPVMESPEPQQGNDDVNVAFVEVLEPGETSTVHSNQVVDVFNQHSDLELDDQTLIGIDPNLNGNTGTLAGVVDELSTHALDEMADSIEGLLDDENPPEVINGSLAFSKVTVYNKVLAMVENNDPRVRSVFGSGNVTEQQVIDFVDNQFETSGRFDASLQRYQEVTQRAADAGTVVVVAAGNDQNVYQGNLNLAAGSAYNFLALSDHVISVAASDDQGTASEADDTIGNFSSRGTGEFNPTVAASGVDVRFSNGQTENGTSFSAPLVASTISEMLAVDSSLSFDEVHSILQQSAFNTSASTQSEGAGIHDQQATLNVTRNFA